MSLQYKNLKFSVDLIEATLSELKLLDKVNSLKFLTRKHKINEALRRYETLWLPLMKNYNGKITAQIDIYWIWHVHMLCPDMYQQDLKINIGKIIDHKFLSENEYNEAIKEIKEIWYEFYPNESFEIMDRKDQRLFVSNFSYDIEEAAFRQSLFYYQVSLPHYRNKQFLENSILRYQKFLTLKKYNPNQCIVPCYDIDIIWHAHQVHPSAYVRDTEKFLGYILPHDDSVNDRSPDSRLAKTDSITRNLWVTTFHEPFSSSGSMFRGESSADQLYDVEISYLYAMRPKIIDMTMSFATDIVRRLKYVLRIYLTTHNAKDKIICSYDYYSKTNTYKCDSFTFSTHDNIGFRVKLFLKIGLCTKKLKFVAQLSTYQDFDFFNPTTLGTTYPYKIEILLNKKVFDTIIVGFSPKSISICESFYGTINVGEFHMVSIKMNNPIIWGLTSLPKYEDSFIDGIMASHSFQNSSGKHVFDINVVHSIKLNQSIVQVNSHDKILSIAHIIDKEQLPLQEQVHITSKCPMLNSKEGQRAMLIKDNKGDWLIVVANWHAAQTIFGYLEMDLFCLRDDCRCVHVEIDKMDNVNFIIDDLFVNLSTGQMELRSCKNLSDLPNYTCLIFAISVLYILCKPRLVSELDLNTNVETLMNLNLTPDIKITGRPLTRNQCSSATLCNMAMDECENAQLLKACGYNYDLYIPSNSYKKQCVDSGGCAGCVGFTKRKYTVESTRKFGADCVDSSYENCVADFISDLDNDSASVEWN